MMSLCHLFILRNWRQPKIEPSRDSFAGTAFTQHWLPPQQPSHETNLVAPIVKLLVVDRSMPYRIGGSLNQKDRAALFNAERGGHCGFGADSFQTVFGFHQWGPVFLFQQREDRLGFAIVGHDFLSQLFWEISLVGRE